MSIPHSAGTSPGGEPEDRLAPEDRAAIAAVDGLGSLSPLDAETVDPEEVARFEAAAGALFVAFTRAGGSVNVPPPGLDARLERAADLYVSSRLSEGGAGADRALGVADAEASQRSGGVHTFPDVRAVGASGPFDGGAESAAPVEAKPATDASPSRLSLLPALAGWAAAAALLIGLLTTARRASDLEDGIATLQTPTERMVQLQLTAKDVVEVSWKPLGAGNRVRGSVLWSDELNEGYMRFKGLAVNDPSATQYQLWIFRGTDPGAEPYPVDGGVFDISATGDVVIPISAKIAVGHAGMFAVTVEEPGGVVVSERKQIVALAQRA